MRLEGRASFRPIGDEPRLKIKFTEAEGERVHQACEPLDCPAGAERDCRP